MNATKPEQKGAAANSGKMLQAMVGIGILCALLIVLTFQGTAPVIKKNKAEALERAIFEVLPGITKKATFQLTDADNFVATTNENAEGKVVYAGYDEKGELVGLAIEASGIGFADILRILYGYDPNQQKIVGFYVLESKETPGLGDKIEKDPDFLANFEGLDVSLNADNSAPENEVVTVKNGEKENPWEIDGITGATISSRAIGDIIGKSTDQIVPLIYKNRETFATPDENN